MYPAIITFRGILDYRSRPSPTLSYSVPECPVLRLTELRTSMRNGRVSLRRKGNPLYGAGKVVVI